MTLGLMTRCFRCGILTQEPLAEEGKDYCYDCAEKSDFLRRVFSSAVPYDFDISTLTVDREQSGPY